MDKEIMDLQVNNNCEKATANINVKVSQHMPDYQAYQICLDYAVPDSIKKDNDIMMSCPDRICAECGNDHSFRGNFAEVITSIDLIPELLYDKMEALGGA